MKENKQITCPLYLNEINSAYVVQYRPSFKYMKGL